MIVHFAPFTLGVASGEGLGYRVCGEREGERGDECRRSQGMGSVRIGTGVSESEIVSRRRIRLG